MQLLRRMPGLNNLRLQSLSWLQSIAVNRRFTNKKNTLRLGPCQIWHLVYASTADKLLLLLSVCQYMSLTWHILCLQAISQFSKRCFLCCFPVRCFQLFDSKCRCWLRSAERRSCRRNSELKSSDIGQKYSVLWSIKDWGQRLRFFSQSRSFIVVALQSRVRTDFSSIWLQRVSAVVLSIVDRSCRK